MENETSRTTITTPTQLHFQYLGRTYKVNTTCVLTFTGEKLRDITVWPHKSELPDGELITAPSQ